MPTKTLRTEARALLAEIVGTAKDPLMIAIEIACDTSKPDPLRLEAALGASKYLHPTLSASAVAHLPHRPDQHGAISMLLDRLTKLSAPAAPILDGSVERLPEVAA